MYFDAFSLMCNLNALWGAGFWRKRATPRLAWGGMLGRTKCRMVLVGDPTFAAHGHLPCLFDYSFAVPYLPKDDPEGNT